MRWLGALLVRGNACASLPAPVLSVPLKLRAPLPVLSAADKRSFTSGKGDNLYGDSPQAIRALELFRAVATPSAAREVDEFMLARQTDLRTLDEWLLSELRQPDENAGTFAVEWKTFASRAMKKDRSNVARRAWTQWEAFGGESDRATPLVAIASEDAASAVREVGVVRLDGCLSEATAATLRQFILARRDCSTAGDSEARSLQLSRVLCAKDADASHETRWDVRLPWDDVVRGAVAELLAPGGRLGDAFDSLSGGGRAELFECAAVISSQGAPPQIVHSDTVMSDQAVLHTAFVALQDVEACQGPTRFLPSTHTCQRTHDALERDWTNFCERSASISALLRSGDCTLYDSRILHCGGPHLRPHRAERTSSLGVRAGGPPPTAVERVLFYVSFRHAAAELSNRDMHGAGSILPAVAALGMNLGALRKPKVPVSFREEMQ